MTSSSSLRALLQRAAEALLLRLHPTVDEVALGDELRVRGAHDVDHDVDEPRHEARLDADVVALLDRPAHDPAQDVPAVLVGRHDAVGDEERHRARVVGQDAQRALLGLGVRRELPAQRHERRELVGLEDRRRALLDERHAVQAQAGVDVLVRQRRERADRVLVELHEHEVPVLEEALVLTAGQVLGRAELDAAVQVELRARAARPGRARLPEVLRARAQHDALARHADGLPGRDRLLVGAEAELLVALEHRDPDVPGLEPETVQRELPRLLDRALLEVVAQGEVAEHLEERQVARGVADVLDVGRAEALLTRRQAVVRRALLAEEVRLERVHARGREQDRRVVVCRDERARCAPHVAALLEEGEVGLPDLIAR